MSCGFNILTEVKYCILVILSTLLYVALNIYTTQRVLLILVLSLPVLFYTFMILSTAFGVLCQYNLLPKEHLFIVQVYFSTVQCLTVNGVSQIISGTLFFALHCTNKQRLH